MMRHNHQMVSANRDWPVSTAFAPFSDFFRPWGWLATSGALDLEDKGDAFEVKVDAPGFTAEQLSAELNKDILTVSGAAAEDEEQERDGVLVRERRSRSFARCLRLPEAVKPDQISTDLAAGVLTIRLPKSEVPAVRKITIGAGSAPQA